MKSVGFTKCQPVDHPEALLDLDIPAPAAPEGHDMLVEVRAVSVNPVDTKRRRTEEPKDGPRILGFDAAGVVRAVGPACTLFRPDDEVFYAPFLGAARPMPTTGNVLVTDGGRSVDALGEATDAIFIAWHFARIVEVTRDEPAVKVFEVRVGDELGAPPGGVVVYRAERAPGLVY